MNIKFKENEAHENELLKVEPILMHVFYYFVKCANECNLPILITSITGDAIGRTSTTHSEGRAIDIATRGFSKLECERIKYELNSKFSKNFGTSPVGGTKRVCVYGDSKHLDHFHLQIRRNIKLLN